MFAIYNLPLSFCPWYMTLTVTYLSLLFLTLYTIQKWCQFTLYAGNSGFHKPLPTNSLLNSLLIDIDKNLKFLSRNLSRLFIQALKKSYD